MKAMILAAGFGKRLKPITDNMPKPLVMVGEYSLIEHNLIKLSKAGIKDVIINIHYKADIIKKYLGDGSRYNLNITYSIEEEILGTGGGIYKCLNFLGVEPFILLSADIFTDFPFQNLYLKDGELASLVLVNNPCFNVRGDFSLDELSKIVVQENQNEYTYASIAIISPEIFNLKKVNSPVFEIAEYFRLAASSGKASGRIYNGLWENVGDLDILERVRNTQKIKANL